MITRYLLYPLLQAKIRLKYRVSFLQGGQEVVETGEVADFPAGL